MKMQKMMKKAVRVTVMAGSVTVAGGVSTAAAQTSLAAQETSIPGGVLVMVTYLMLWALLGGYLFMIMRRQRALQRDLEGLDARIDGVLGGTGDDLQG